MKINISIQLRQRENSAMSETSEKSDEIIEPNLEYDLPQHILEKYDGDTQVQLIKAYRILQVILYYPSNATFFTKPDNVKHGTVSYHDVIEKPMWFNEIKRKFFNAEYSSITEVIKDMRLIFENCYKFWGPATEQAESCLKIERLMEKQISLLPKDLRVLCSLDETHGKNEDEWIMKFWNKNKLKNKNKGKNYSILMLRTLKKEGIKEHDKYMEKADLSKFCKNSEEIMKWENEVLLLSDHIQTICASSELPFVGQFLHLIHKLFEFGPLCQTEVERMFFMPRYSSSFRNILKVLLSYNSGDDNKEPSYDELIAELSSTVSEWYTIRKNNSNDDFEVFKIIGVDSNFFKFIGERNLLAKKKYEKLPYHQRVLIIKALCDHLMHSRSYIREVINEHSKTEISARVLGRDKSGYSYLYFDMFPDFRLYKQKVKIKEKRNKEPLKDDIEEDEKMVPIKFFDDACDEFYMIADSIDEMNNVIDELFYTDLDNVKKDNKSGNTEILEALRNLKTEVLNKEDNFIKYTNEARIKLFEEWKAQQEQVTEQNNVSEPTETISSLLIKSEPDEMDGDTFNLNNTNILLNTKDESITSDLDNIKKEEDSASSVEKTRRRRTSVPSYNLNQDLYFSDNDDTYSPEEVYSSESESDDDWEIPKKRTRKGKKSSLKNGNGRIGNRKFRGTSLSAAYSPRRFVPIEPKPNSISNNNLSLNEQNQQQQQIQSLSDITKIKVIDLAKLKAEPVEDPLKDPLKISPEKIHPQPIILQPATVIGTLPIINSCTSLQPVVNIIGQPNLVNQYMVNSTTQQPVKLNRSSTVGQIRQTTLQSLPSTRFITANTNKSQLITTIPVINKSYRVTAGFPQSSMNASVITTGTTNNRTNYPSIRPVTDKSVNLAKPFTLNPINPKDVLPAKFNRSFNFVPKLVNIVQPDNPNIVKNIEGTIGIHSNGSKLQYVVNLANGTRVPLSNEQVQKLRSGNNGVLPQKLKIPVPSDVAEKIEPCVVIDD